MEPRILIVDDHEIVREGVRSLLANMRPKWDICGEASNGVEAIDAISKLRPDVVILDITMPNMSGFDVAARLRDLGMATRILFFTMHDSESLPTEVRKTGAAGFVLKSEAARNLVRAIETVQGGGTFFGSPQSGKPGKDVNLGMLFLRLNYWPA